MTTWAAVAEKLRRRILADITAGRLPPGARLGSERELAEHYGVSRATLRQVLATLAESGLVHRVPGRSGGTFVSHAKVERDVSSMVGVPAYLARQGYVAGTRLISARMGPADPTTSAALQLEEGALVVDLHRLRLADALPFSLDRAQFTADRFPGLLEKPLGGSLYDLLAKEFGVVPSDAEERVEVVHATDDESALLSVETGAALLSVTRTTYDAEGVPFEYSHDLFRADKTQIVLRTHGTGLRAVGGDTGTPENPAHFVLITPARKGADSQPSV